MAVRRQDDQHEHTFSSYVRIRDVVLKTSLGRWTIGRSGERGSGISVLPARHDDDKNIRFEKKINLYIYIYIYIYRYHTITDVCTTALLLIKPSSDDDSGFRHGFGAEASLPLNQSAPAVSHDTTRLCQIVVAVWDCQIHADAGCLSWIFSMYFLLSDGGSPRLVKKMEVELAIKPLHPTSIGNTFVIQPFLTHCSRRSSYFSNLPWCAQ